MKRRAAAILKALASALKTLDEDTASIFIELTELGLGTAPAAQTWRNLMAVDLSTTSGTASPTVTTRTC